jgi:CheY-like chemotaxis protein
MSVRVLVVDDESDVETLFRQQFRRELREGRFVMDFALSAEEALMKVRDAEGATIIMLVSDINMPGMSGLDLLPRIKAERPDIPVLMVDGVWRRDHSKVGIGARCRWVFDQANRLHRNAVSGPGAISRIAHCPSLHWQGPNGVGSSSG